MRNRGPGKWDSKRKDEIGTKVAELLEAVDKKDLQILSADDKDYIKNRLHSNIKDNRFGMQFK
jgi:hypothetical protein